MAMEVVVDLVMAIMGMEEDPEVSFLKHLGFIRLLSCNLLSILHI